MLRKNAKIDLIARVPLFERCSKRELAEIASVADEVDLPSARNLTREGTTGWEFVILVEGEADVVRKGKVVNELGPGDFVGEIALVSGKPRTATVRTRGPSRVLVLTVAAIYLPHGPGLRGGVALSVNAGFWAAAVISLSGEPFDVVKALPAVLLILPAAWLVARGASIAVKVASSWLIAIAILAATLPFLPVTPGYMPDHLE